MLKILIKEEMKEKEERRIEFKLSLDKILFKMKKSKTNEEWRKGENSFLNKIMGFSGDGKKFLKQEEKIEYWKRYKSIFPPKKDEFYPPQYSQN